MKKLQKEYKVGNKTYRYSLKDMRFSYFTFINMSDEEFLRNIVDALHFAVYVCWVKEVSSDECLADDGIIHELVHLVKKNTRQYTDLVKIRKKFEEILII